MKRIVLFIITLAVAVGLQAAQFGAALDMTVKVDGRTYGTANATQLDMGFQPSFIIKLDSMVQLEPFIGIAYHSESDPGGVAPWGDNVQTATFQCGAGLYVFPARLDRWSFGTGAKLTFLFGTPFVSSIEVPFLIEFALTDNVHIRISQKIAGLAFSSQSSGSGATLVQLNNFEFSTFVNGFNPYFGFSFYF